jgi:hypothetical protein
MSFGWSDILAHRAGDDLPIAGKERLPLCFQGQAASGVIMVTAPGPPDHEAAERAKIGIGSRPFHLSVDTKPPTACHNQSRVPWPLAWRNPSQPRGSQEDRRTGSHSAVWPVDVLQRAFS